VVLGDFGGDGGDGSHIDCSSSSSSRATGL